MNSNQSIDLRQRASVAAAGFGKIAQTATSAALLVLLLSLPGCCIPKRPLEAINVLAGVVHPDRLHEGKEPQRTTVNYEARGSIHRGDIYLPPHPSAGILLVPGAAQAGKDDARVVAFANALARADFAVLVPDLVDVRQLKPGPRDVREIADGFAYLVSRPDLAPQGRAGIAAASYAVGPAVLAAIEPGIRDRVHFILGIGGYYDLPAVIAFFTTGYFRDGSRWQYLSPNEYGKWVFALSNADRLRDPADRRAIRAIAVRKMEHSDATVEPAVRQLHREGLAMYELLTNTDPRRVPGLIQRLPGPIRSDIAALDLSRHDLSTLRARLILVHGRDDAMIPYTQSVALARAVRPGQATVYLIHGLAHVDVRTLGPAAALKVLCAIDAVLAEQTQPSR